MKKENLTFTFDPSDLVGMRKLMDEKGDSETMFFGSNELDEDINISISHDRIDTVTYQQNGWTRRNVYWRDGTSEELFEDKWNK